MKYFGRISALAAGAILLSAVCSFFAFASGTMQLYVNPNGSDSNDGKSAQTAFKTIQRALDAAQPGTVINLAEGIYRENITTKISATESAPIIIRGGDTAKNVNRRHRTVIYGTGRIVNIDHSFYRFEGFAIDGQEALADQTFPSDRALVIAFKTANRAVIKDSKLIYIGSADTSRGVTGIKISNMYLRGAGGECVRIRNAAHHNEISNSVIEYCGMFAKDGEGFLYHNGEGVYIGTSPKSTSQPMHAADESAYNIVADNTIHTYGSECFNVKENAHHNSFVGNECRYNLEPLRFSGSNVELRGDHNLIDSNRISDSEGWNLKIKSDGADYDISGNVVKRNKFANARKANIHTEAVAVFCGNGIDAETEGVTFAEATKPCAESP